MSPSFFMVGVWFESVLTHQDAAVDRMAGLNTYVELTRDSDLRIVRAAGMHAIHSGAPVDEGDETNGWLTSDEVDMWAGAGSAGWTGSYPGEGPICQPPAAKCGFTVLSALNGRLPHDGRMRYANFGKGVTFWASLPEARRFVSSRYQDVVSADNYWHTDENICSRFEGGALLARSARPLTAAECHRAANYGATVRRLRALTGRRRPVWAFVEVGHPSADPRWPTVTPAQVRAAVWQNLIAGARGIVYFNHSFGGPCQTQHALREPCYRNVRTTVARTNAQIRQLAPALNGPYVSGGWGHSKGTTATLKWAGGQFYLFAGSAGSATTGRFTAPCVREGTATVIDEHRTVPIRNGTFTDVFADADAIHLYRITPAGCRPR